MGRYRKRPAEIEAFQITKETRWDNRDWPEWLNMAWNAPRYQEGAVSPWKDEERCDELVVMTLEGPVKCQLGDWIIKGIRGELYPCKPDIFAATYDEVK